MGMEWVLSREPTPVCNPLCRFFRCRKMLGPGRYALDIHRDPPWCNWVNSACIGYKCPYASCAQVKLLPDGRCGVFVKRKTVEKEPEEVLPRIGLTEKSKKRLEDLGL